jgi:zinc/manganese transport system permease protein
VAILGAVIIGLLAVWGGVWMAYESYYWFSGNSWPVSFFVVAIIFIIYLLTIPLKYMTSRKTSALVAVQHATGAS